MKEVLQQLANLQYIDSRIDELKQLRGDLPEDILDVETDIARLEAKQAKLEQEDKDLSVELNQLELDITSSTEKVSKYEEQQLTVRNNREYDALTKEIEVQKQVIEKAHLRIEEAKKRKELVAPEKAIIY
jgi:predicted  nucleic acid-binding Zn-ribbon protein